MASKDLYNAFGSARNSGAGQTQMMKKRTPRPTENTHEHTSGSFGGQDMVNQLERRDLVKRIGEAGGSVAESARSRPTDQTAASARRVTTSNTRAATPIGTRQATPIGGRAATPIGTRQATPIGGRVSAPLQNTPTGVGVNRAGGVSGNNTKPPTGGGVGAAGPKQMNPKKRSGGATR